jgi:hypothetical protein
VGYRAPRPEGRGFSVGLAEDSSENWGSCFYFLRPRLKTSLEIVQGLWYKDQLGAYGVLKILGEQQVSVASQLPLNVRLRIDVEGGDDLPEPVWVIKGVEANGTFRVNIKDFPGSPGAVARVQAWFDRTDLLGSSRSEVREFEHNAEPVVH